MSLKQSDKLGERLSENLANQSNFKSRRDNFFGRAQKIAAERFRQFGTSGDFAEWLGSFKKALFLEKCFKFSYRNAFLSAKADFEILEIDFGLSKFKFHEQTTTGDKKRRFGIGKYFCAVFVCDLTDLLNPKVLLKDRFI